MRWALLIVLAGCGDNDFGDPAGAHSGSRLKIDRHVYGDGTAQVETRWFFDSARGERCTSKRWSDGATYCTPDTGDVVGIDDACTMFVGRVPAGTLPTYFETFYALDGKPAISRLVLPGAKTQLASYYLPTPDGRCDGPFTATDDYYELGEELTSDAFARVRHTSPVGDAERLVLVIASSDDGLRVPVGITDDALDIGCTLPPHHGASQVTCAPSVATVSVYFHDLDCKIPIVSAVTAPNAVSLVDPLGCASYYQIGSEVTGTPLYEPAGNTCTTIQVSSNEHQWLIGDRLDLATLARSEGAAHARFTPIALTAGTMHVADTLIRDTQLATDCTYDDTTGRCLPASETPVHAFFADAQCQQPLPLAMVSTASCAAPATFAELRPIGDRYTQPFFEVSTGDICAPFAVPAGIEPHVTADPLPLDSFADATDEIDP